MMEHEKQIQPWRFVALAIVACCAFIVGASVAKMTHDIQVGNEELQVAKWNVTAESTGSSGDISLMAGGDMQTYALMVTNNSEVASDYAIQVSGIPSGVKVGLDITSETDLQTPVDGVVTFSDTGGVLSYDSENDNNTRPHILTLLATPEANITSDVGESMAVNVLFEQKRPQ